MNVVFLDSGREPKCAPNPAYPLGKDVDISGSAAATCSTPIPYPAPRCGVMFVTCPVCGYSVGLTVAGRIDDPRSVKVPCKMDKVTRQ